ncbi:MAG TPA: translation initiation factor IF-2 [Candidatus Paceibacterota bacterium]|nr:translation initiation factor IF-2 [Candidatus Paceibacterota bacterium]
MPKTLHKAKNISPQTAALPKAEGKRPPVVVVMGHIDHGKSTLLDAIRKTKVTETEAGGITQHVSAYEVTHKNEKGADEKITFLDTPGHEAFSAARRRGANVADIAILVVAADDGVKTQTLEALSALQETKTPFIVALTKIDKPGANVEIAKSSLIENGIYVEGYGGDIPCVPLSSKTGEGINELLEMILLVSDLAELRGDSSLPASGTVLESNLDAKKGIGATLIIQNGTIKKGLFVVSGDAYAPVRMMEDFQGKAIAEASFSSPVKIIGWNKLPEIGAPFTLAASKKEAEKMITEKNEPAAAATSSRTVATDEIAVIPIILKTDVAGTRDGVLHEIGKLNQAHEHVKLQIISSGVGAVSENDVHLASGSGGTVILGFHVSADARIQDAAARGEILIQTFDIIYQMTEWLESEMTRRKPKIAVEESIAKAKILRVFSNTKNAYVAGGKVTEGTLRTGSHIKIFRRDAEIGRGKIVELQHGRTKTDKVEADLEFGIKIETRTEIVRGDTFEVFVIKENE